MADVENSIVFPNVHEYMRRGMEPGFAKNLLKEWCDIAAGYAEVSMFWEGNNKLILSPKPIYKSFIDYNKALLGYGEISVAVPRSYSSETSIDFLNDSDVLSEINSYVCNKDNVHFLPWGATEKVYDLLNKILTQNPQVISHELPPMDDYWTSLYYDSKIGFRELCTDLQKTNLQIHIPKGYCCGTMKEALAIIRSLHKKGKASVLKANSGAGGFGNIFISDQLLNQPFLKVEQYIYKSIEELPYFKSGAILIEEFVNSPLDTLNKNTNIHSCFMSGCIKPDGSMKITAGGIDIRDNYNYYSGARLGMGVFPKRLQNKLETVMNILGQSIASNGYCGQWGVNFIITENNTPVMIELNPRRCGESHVHALGKRLYGEDWMKASYVLSRLPLEVEILNNFSIELILSLFERMSNKNKDVYVIPTQLGWLNKERFPGIGYVIIGNNKNQVEASDKQLLNGLMEIGIKPLLGNISKKILY